EDPSAPSPADPVAPQPRRDDPVTMQPGLETTRSQQDLVSIQPGHIATQLPSDPVTAQPRRQATRSYYSPLPGYRIPNLISDEIMPTLTTPEQSVLQCLIRLSWGFNRVTTDPVGVAKLAEKCNLGETAVKKALKELQAKGRIEIHIDDSGNPKGGNRNTVLVGLFNDPVAERPGRKEAPSGGTRIKDHDDLNKTIDHQSETMRIYQTLTGNAWTKADQPAYEKINSIPLDHIESVIRAVLDRAKDPPRSLNYFVGEILSGGRTGKGREAHRKKIEKIVARLRDLHIGGDFEGFRAHVEKECAKEGVIFDLDLFNEIVKGVR